MESAWKTVPAQRHGKNRHGKRQGNVTYAESRKSVTESDTCAAKRHGKTATESVTEFYT